MLWELLDKYAFALLRDIDAAGGREDAAALEVVEFLVREAFRLHMADARFDEVEVEAVGGVTCYARAEEICLVGGHLRARGEEETYAVLVAQTVEGLGRQTCAARCGTAEQIVAEGRGSAEIGNVECDVLGRACADEEALACLNQCAFGQGGESKFVLALQINDCVEGDVGYRGNNHRHEE